MENGDVPPLCISLRLPMLDSPIKNLQLDASISERLFQFQRRVPVNDRITIITIARSTYASSIGWNQSLKYLDILQMGKL